MVRWHLHGDGDDVDPLVLDELERVGVPAFGAEHLGGRFGAFLATCGNASEDQRGLRCEGGNMGCARPACLCVRADNADPKLTVRHDDAPTIGARSRAVAGHLGDGIDQFKSISSMRHHPPHGWRRCLRAINNTAVAYPRRPAPISAKPGEKRRTGRNGTSAGRGVGRSGGAS